MYKLKQIPEDFAVREISNFEIGEEGEYHIFLLKKRGISTPDACDLIAKIVKKGIKYISYAGNKDKEAVTEQLISIKSDYPMQEIGHEKIQTTFVGKSKIPISLGNLEGNEFEIVVRNIESIRQRGGSPQSSGYFPNYFDEQRFSKNNVQVGLALLKKNFKNAAFMIVNKKVKKYLEEKPNDFVGALKRLSRKELMIYVHSVQSLIFNETVSRYLLSYLSNYSSKYSKDSAGEFSEVAYNSGEENNNLNSRFMIFPEDVRTIHQGVSKELFYRELAIPGFGTRLDEADEFQNITMQIMKELKINDRDFIIRQLEGISPEGAMRKMFVKINNLEIGKLEDDDLNNGMKKVKIKFSLPKGSYATIAVKAMIGYKNG